LCGYPGNRSKLREDVLADIDLRRPLRYHIDQPIEPVNADLTIPPLAGIELQRSGEGGVPAGDDLREVASFRQPVPVMEML